MMFFLTPPPSLGRLGAAGAGEAAGAGTGAVTGAGERAGERTGVKLEGWFRTFR